MTSITVSAPAKVNLFLKVLSKRKDSYHNILTIFERISLADKIKISKIPEGIVVKPDVFITRNPKDNLVYKAAKMILSKGGVRAGVKIEIKKNVPIAAGLGGGSSDAAATLIGINKLFNLKLSNKILFSLGKKLGADVSFFMIDTPFAIGKGIGDKISIIKSKTRLWHLLIYPGFKLATKDVYRAFDKRDFALTRGFGDAKIHFQLYNDLEEASISRKRVIGKILKGLAQLLNKKAIVSGSGPSLFCLYGTRKEALRARTKVLKSVPARERQGWQIYVVKTH